MSAISVRPYKTSPVDVIFCSELVLMLLVLYGKAWHGFHMRTTNSIPEAMEEKPFFI